jgi:hypothetical protein
VHEADQAIQGLQADGIMGMAPRVSSGDNAQLFVQNLYENGLIAKNGFGVDYNKEGTDSIITLGGYDTSKVANDTLFSWIDLSDTFYWRVILKGTTYGTKQLDISADRAILDTGTSLTYFPSSDFAKVWAEISSGRNWGYSSTTGFRAWEWDSEDDFEDITLHLDGYIFYFSKKAYITVDSGVLQNICEFWIDELDFNVGRPSILLGDSFFRNYYIYHDAENTRLGMYGKAISGSMILPRYNSLIAAITVAFTINFLI